MRGPDYRRLLRRPRLQGYPRSGTARLSDLRWMTGICSGRAQSPGICWNARARLPAVTSPTPATRISPIWHGSAFRSAMDDWNLLGQGTVAGHLLECAGQITGGYFADPGYKDIPDLARLGFPIGEVGEDGSLVITKVAGSGGAVTAQTCKEQLLYEVHDPRQYIQPDVVADLSQVKVEEIAR